MSADRNRRRPFDHSIKKSRRENIIKLALQGVIRPGVANKMARDEGLRPFVDTPDPNDYLIMDDATWTIEMVVAWIIWRHPSEVVRYFSPFRQKITQWKQILSLNSSPAYKFKLETNPPANLAAVKHESESGIFRPNGRAVNQRLFKFSEAKRDLWRNLEIGALKGRAIVIEGSRPIEIPSLDWSYLEASMNEQGPTELKFRSSSTPQYKDVTFVRSDVFRIWPQADSLLETCPGSVAGKSDHASAPRKEITPSRSSSAPPDIRRAIIAAATFFADRGYLMWTRDEAYKQLRELLGASRAKCKPIFAKEGIEAYFPGKRGRRGPVNINRDKELAEFRQFFESANMRK